MSYYKYPKAPSYIVLFSYSVDAAFEEEARKKLRKVSIRCEAFAKAIDIHFHDDCVLFNDEEQNASMRLVFNIKEPQDSIFLKMPCLINFAACLQLKFCNQTLYPE